MLKSELRRLVRLQVNQYTDDERAKLSRDTVLQLLAHPRIKCAHVIMMYWSLPDEVDIQEAVRHLYQEGKTVLLPVTQTGGIMYLRCYEGDDSLRVGNFHIMEPTGPIYIQLSQIDTVVIPGVCFDKGGHRLGRGRGYYDRFLPRIPQAFRLGIAFPCQIQTNIPTDTHDVMMDEILSLTNR